MKILIIGNSYAADWTVKFPDRKGWSNFLSEKFEVTNLAQCGVGEYKIYKQIENIDISVFDLIITSHHHFSRVHTKLHPLWSKDVLMKDCDLIYSDLEHHSKKFKNIFNWSLKCAERFFFYHYDHDYQFFIHSLIKEKIYLKIKDKNVIIINDIITEEFEKKYHGKCNHLSDTGNKIVYERILSKIEEIGKING